MLSTSRDRSRCSPSLRWELEVRSCSRRHPGLSVVGCAEVEFCRRPRATCARTSPRAALTASCARRRSCRSRPHLAVALLSRRNPAATVRLFGSLRRRVASRSFRRACTWQPVPSAPRPSIFASRGRCQWALARYWTSGRYPSQTRVIPG